MPKITVITPIYNCERFVKESLVSILNQSFADFEFIVVNDGSTDSTNEIASKITDSRIRYLNHDINKGVMRCSREALDLATTEYVAVHDGDDISMSNRLELQYNFLQSNPDIFCVGGYAKKIDVTGSLIGDWNFPPKKHQDIVTMLTGKHKCPIINPTAMFRLKDYKEIGGYSPHDAILYAHDFDFWCRAILSKRKFANLQDFLIKYRVNPDGMTRGKKLLQLMDYEKIISVFLREVKNVKL